MKIFKRAICPRERLYINAVVAREKAWHNQPACITDSHTADFAEHYASQSPGPLRAFAAKRTAFARSSFLSVFSLYLYSGIAACGRGLYHP